MYARSHIAIGTRKEQIVLEYFWTQKQDELT